MADAVRVDLTAERTFCRDVFQSAQQQIQRGHALLPVYNVLLAAFAVQHQSAQAVALAVFEKMVLQVVQKLVHMKRLPFVGALVVRNMQRRQV